MTNNDFNPSYRKPVKFFVVQEKWKEILRNNKKVPVTRTQLELMGTLHNLIERSPSGTAYFSLNWVCKKLNVGERHFRRIRRELAHIYSSEWVEEIKIDGKRLRNVYIFKYTPNGRQILGVSDSIKKPKIKAVCPPPDASSCPPPTYIENNKNKNRSISNFQNFEKFKEAKPLASFYPLTEEQAEELRRKSGRDFSLNAMNEILKDMSRKLPDRTFYSKNAFMIYMTKVFANEMRDSVKVSNESFKIKANLTKEERRREEIDEYLTNIEYSRDVSPEWHLKKKLACVLKPETAFEVLRNYRRIDVKANRALIELNKHIELNVGEKDIILSQVQATHERLNEEGIYLPITELEIKMPKRIERENTVGQISVEPIERKGIWGEIRRITADYFDKYKGKGSGEGIDRAWFSKLEAEIDEGTKQIKLKAPDDLCKSWIENNYAYDLRDAALSKGFNIQEIYCY